MARKVFFSFHFERDVFRVMQVRNSWVIRNRGEAQPFYDKAQFEEAKRRAGGIERWIEEQLHGTSVTVVLIGAETAARKWVNHEIKRSFELGKGMLGIYLNNMNDPRHGQDVRGANPFENWTCEIGGRQVSFASLYSTYDWIRDDGYNNFAAWVEQAAADVGRK